MPSFHAWAAAAVLGATALLPGPAHAIEEPAFEVTQVFETFEVRQYAPYLVAETIVPGPAEDAGNPGFRILAGYIFGRNKGERTLEMTAPVTLSAAAAAAGPAASTASAVPAGSNASAGSMTLGATAPVTQSAATADGLFRVQFVMPRGFTLATLPEPLDARVTLREVPAQRVAVLRYSGGWSQSLYDEKLALLTRELQARGIAWQGEPVLSRYDGPFTLWFMRRNEIWLPLAPG